MPLVEFVHVTAQYSNAVLVAILPYVSQFAGRLELPIHKPIIFAEVSRFECDARSGEVGGWLTLTNGFQFWFSRGHIDSFESPRDYFASQDPSQIKNYYGRLNITTNQAISLARKTIGKLGYSEAALFMDRPPIIEGPVRVDADLIPFFRITWQRPIEDTVSIRIDVNGETQTVEKLLLLNTNCWKPSPKIPVQAELLSDYQARIRKITPARKLESPKRIAQPTAHPQHERKGEILNAK